MPKEKDELLPALENKPREVVGVGVRVAGVNHIASHQNGLCGMSKNLAFDSGKSLTDMLQSLFQNQMQTDFPFA